MKHVVVVGAGPAGVATSWLLARQGMKVTLIEKETRFDRVFRGEGLMPAGLDALYQMEMKETFEFHTLSPARCLGLLCGRTKTNARGRT